VKRDPYARFQALRWRVYFILVVSYMLVFFHRMAPSAVASDLMLAFQTSGAALGSLAARYCCVCTTMQVPSGILADTLGPRISVTAGSMVAGLGSIIFGLADDFAMASAGRFLVGLGVSVVFVGLMRSNAVWFSDRHYGRVSGLTLLLGNLGSIMAAAPSAWALGFFSWREIFVGIGIGSLLMALLTWDGTLVDGLRQYAWLDYRNGLWLSFGFSVLAVLAALRVRETHCRNISAEMS